MPLPDQTPRLPKWPFLIGDAALLGAAWLIGTHSNTPLPSEAVFAIAGCCVCAVITGAIPFLADYARKQDVALDERQRSLESLARTASTAAEQISIAAAGFNEIAELVQKNIRHAEQLPQKLHEKIAEFQARLALTTDEEKEELERELASLRSSESEKLESIADKVARASADWAKVESAVQKQGSATKALLGQFDESVAQFEKRIDQFEHRIARLGGNPESAAGAAPIHPASKPHPSSDATGPARESAPAEPASEPVPAKRQDASVPGPAVQGSAAAAEPPGKPSAGVQKSAPEPAAAPVKAERKRAPKRPVEPPVPVGAGAARSAPEPVKPAAPVREKQPAAPRIENISEKRREPNPTEPLALEFSQSSPDDGAPSVAVSADGATRLLVTAYIGIGNRLFIRGDGPGLSWDKGVALQFVSIGKWRWETADATAPVKFKLYKNDEMEFSGLDAPPIEPGRQMEMTATL